MARRREPPRDEPPAGPFNDAFRRLESLRGGLPAGEAHDEQASTPAPEALPERAVLRYERKGRGGKEATIVERLELAPERLEVWLGEIRRALGCGGKREGGELVLQGDQRERVRAWLKARGVRHISG